MRAASFSFACSLISPLPASDRCLSLPWLLLGQVTLSHAFLFLPRGRAGCSPSAAHPCLPGVNAAPPFPHPSFPIFPRFLPRVCHERPSSSRCLTNRDPALHHAAVRAPALAGAAVQLLLPPRRCLARAPHVPSLFFFPARDCHGVLVHRRRRCLATARTDAPVPRGLSASEPVPRAASPPSFFPLPVSAGHPTEPRHHRVRASSRQGCPPPSPDHCTHPRSAPRLHRGRAPQCRRGSARRRLAQPRPALCHHRARIIVDDRIPFGPKIRRTQGIPLQFLESLAP